MLADWLQKKLRSRKCSGHKGYFMIIFTFKYYVHIPISFICLFFSSCIFFSVPYLCFGLYTGKKLLSRFDLKNFFTKPTHSSATNLSFYFLSIVVFDTHPPNTLYESDFILVIIYLLNTFSISGFYSLFCVFFNFSSSLVLVALLSLSLSLSLSLYTHVHTYTYMCRWHVNGTLFCCHRY